VQIRDGRYVAPAQPGFSAEMHQESLQDHLFPDGRVWQQAAPGMHRS
jgi:L-fuconate dehydratase